MTMVFAAVMMFGIHTQAANSESVKVEMEEFSNDAVALANDLNFKYTVNDDGTATITGYKGEVSGDLIIPD